MTATSLQAYLADAQEQLALIRFRLATAPISERSLLISQARTLAIAIGTVCYEYATRESHGLAAIGSEAAAQHPLPTATTVRD